MNRLLVVVALAGCASKKEAPVEPPAATPFPRVADSAAILPLAKTPRPTHVVWIDAAGALSLAPADRVWTGGLPTTRQPIASLDALAAAVRPAEPSDPDPWSARPRRDGVEALRGYLRAPAAIGTRDLDDPHVLVLAPPDAPARRVVELVESVGGRLGVALPKAQLGALRVVFRARTAERENEVVSPWVELHLATAGIDVLALPENGPARVAWGKAMPDELRAIVTSYGKQGPRLDVFAADGVTHQQLVDTLVALDAAGVTTLALGSSPGPAAERTAQITAIEAARAGALMTPRAAMAMGQPNTQGDLDRAIIRSVLRGQAQTLLACYDAALAKLPDLRGTVSVQFFISPDGTVAVSNASGVSPDVATCMASAVKAITFPRPRGGGGVQVSYPFTFRPRET